MQSWYTLSRAGGLEWGLSTLAVLGTLGATNATQTSTVNAAAKGNVATVNYVKGQGVALWKDAPSVKFAGRHLSTNSKWKNFKVEKGNNGSLFFELGRNEIGDSKYLDLRDETSIQNLRGVVQIKYVPGYGIALWDSPYAGRHMLQPNRCLQHVTRWKVFERAVVDGKSWYNVGLDANSGKDMWIDVSYAVLTSETSRGQKRYIKNGPTISDYSGDNNGSTTANTTKLGSTTKPEGNTTKPEENSKPATEAFNAAVVESLVLQKINYYRASLGLRPNIIGNSLVNSWAHTRVSELSTNYAHVRPNGESIDDSQTWKNFGFENFYGGGENLIALPFLGTTNEQTAEEIVKGWKNDFYHNVVMTEKVPGYMAVGVINDNGNAIAAFENVQTHWTSLMTNPKVDPDRTKADWEK